MQYRRALFWKYLLDLNVTFTHSSSNINTERGFSFAVSVLGC